MGSWWKLVGIIDEARQIEEKDRTTAPTSCVSCYTPLKRAADGKLFCPWDGLVWPDDASAWGEYPGSY